LARKSVNLATQDFPSQTAATAFYRAMLSRYSPGDRVSAEDCLHLAALLERHHEYKLKVGTGVDHFSVMLTEHGTTCFRIERNDGSGTDFSFYQCVEGRAPSRKQEVSQAFREVVRIELYGIRDNILAQNTDEDGLIACAATKERVSPNDTQIDHRPPMNFEVIVTTFLGGRGLSVDDVPITSSRDDQVKPKITDNKLTEEFQLYHRRVATVDLVKTRVNLGQSTPNRIKKTRSAPFSPQ
jgi:hypothetical protein